MTSAERPVLIVDDDLDIRETLTELLEGRGFEIISAANGLEALKLLGSLAAAPSGECYLIASPASREVRCVSLDS